MTRPPRTADARRRLATVLLAALLGHACGGEAESTSPVDAPAPAGTEHVAAGKTEADTPPAAAPLRVRLFDLMDRAERDALPVDGELSPPTSVRFDFETGLIDGLAFGLANRTRVKYSAVAQDPGAGEASGEPSVRPDRGLEGAALGIGPNVSDRSHAAFVLPAAGFARVVVRGRVRLVGNPDAGEGSAREVLRIVELARVTESVEVGRRERYRAPTRRTSRSIDPTGWDRFEESFVTRSSTRALELHLMHQGGGHAAAVTLFDAIEVEVTPMTAAEALTDIARRYRPRDGQEALTPWRLRVPLRSSVTRKSEVRDAVLLAPPGLIAFPVSLPAAEVPTRLRFGYGMLPEAFAEPGDGARITVRFRSDAQEGAAAVELASLDLNPKAEKAQRAWLEALVDLTPVAGQTGRLEFAAEDADGILDFDPVLIATPRIEPANAVPAAFNVLLVGVDTLRADHMSAFGYERPTSPNLERLAREGVVFTSARSQAPWTLPSFSSILTSLYPSAHGAGRGGHDEWTAIDPTTTSLAEILARVGYETQGIVANGLISPEYGLDQGFDAYGSAWTMESAETDAGGVAQWIEEHTQTPWLLFWHIMDPHLPYDTDDVYREQFTDSDYAGRFAGGRRQAVPFQVLDPRPGRRWFAHEGPPPPPELSAEDVEFVSDYYDAEIAEMDAALGQVVEALERSGQWERTIVAFVADHGEGLGDHGHYHHGYTLFEDQVHIPMLVRIPGRDVGRVVERAVAAIDLAPTILGALGLEPPDGFHGVDRLAPDAPTDDAYFIEYPTYDSSAEKAWVLGDFKYVHDPVFHTASLYHMADDPGEMRDVSDSHPDVVRRARAELDAFRWEEAQKGRFHLRVRGAKGQVLRVRVATDDLFDANFVARPLTDEERFEMDLERKFLTLETALEGDRLELVFWFRGNTLDVAVELDGEPVKYGIVLGDEEEQVSAPASFRREHVPEDEGAELGWPAPDTALLWLEAGVGEALPVVPSPEEIEVLQQLGYSR